MKTTSEARKRRVIIPSRISVKLLKEKAPSIFTEKAHPKMSHWYKFINTNTVLRKLYDLGFVSYDANQVNYRDESNDNNGFQYHCVYLYHPNMVILNTNESSIESLFELILINSYNGTSKCTLNCTLYDVYFDSDTLCLSDNFTEIINDVTDLNDENYQNKLVDHFFEIVKLTTVMKKKILSDEEKKQLVEDVTKLRFDSDVTKLDYMFMIDPINDSDKSKDDLWTLYLRLQYRMIKGYSFPEGSEQVGRKIRSINNIQTNIDLNKKIFQEVVKFI